MIRLVGERLDANISELDPHWLAGVELQGELAVEEGELGGVGEIEYKPSV